MKNLVNNLKNSSIKFYQKRIAPKMFAVGIISAATMGIGNCNMVAAAEKEYDNYLEDTNEMNRNLSKSNGIYNKIISFVKSFYNKDYYYNLINNATPSNATPSNATPSNATPSNATPSNATPSNATEMTYEEAEQKYGSREIEKLERVRNLLEKNNRLMESNVYVTLKNDDTKIYQSYEELPTIAAGGDGKNPKKSYWGSDKLRVITKWRMVNSEGYKINLDSEYDVQMYLESGWQIEGVRLANAESINSKKDFEYECWVSYDEVMQLHLSR